MANITLTLATTPAELGDAATQDDMAAYNALVEERNLEGREVPEEFFLALLDEAGGREGLTFEVRVIQDGEATVGALGRTLVCAATMEDALRLGRGVALDYFQGVAIVDTGARVIDWGGEVTDYEGREVIDAAATLAEAEALFADANGAWTSADWTHEVRGTSPVEYCSGDCEGCTYCEEAVASAGHAQDMGEQAIAHARSGEWQKAAKAAREAANTEGEWGDSPTWGDFARHLEAAAEKAGH